MSAASHSPFRFFTTVAFAKPGLPGVGGLRGAVRDLMQLLLSATLLPMGSEPALFGLIQLNPDMFWPAIAVATVAIITRGQRWPWYASIALAAVGVGVAASAYVGGAH